MASITKQKTGWRVQVYVKGQRDSAMLPTKAEAQAWAVEREGEMRRMVKTGVNTDKTVHDAFDRYAREVSAHKKTSTREQKRLIALAAHEVNGERLGSFKLCEVTTDLLGQWRDSRLKTVAGSTIVRDLNLLSNVFATARREWKWIAVSPTTDLRRPKTPPARDRRISDREIEEMCIALGLGDSLVRTKSQAVAVAFLFAIETAMRAGEILGLTAADIQGRTATLHDTKNGTRRIVPMSKKALSLLKLLPPGDGTLFGLTPASLDALFRKARERTTITNLTFHDTRHEAITRLAKRLDVLELARMVGHRDIRNLMIYYNATAEELADKL